MSTPALNISFTNVVFIGGLFYWIALNCTVLMLCPPLVLRKSQPSFIYAFQMHFSYHFQASIVFPDSWNLLELCNHSLWTSSLQYFFIIVAWCKLIWGVHAALPHSDDITLKENNAHLMLTVSSSGWCLRLFRVSCIYSSLISHHHRYMYTKPHYHHNYLKKTIYKNIIILCWYRNFKRNINEHAYISVLL